MLRSEYVLKTVFCACNSNASPPISAYEYGWELVSNKIVWDEEEVMDKVRANKRCGCNGAKCDGSRDGCIMCRPCTMKSKCKLKCNNHNNGGTCPRCVHVCPR